MTEPIVNPVVAVEAPQPVVEPVARPAVVAQKLPDTATDRTREQFDKLLESNRLLAESNEQLRLDNARRTQVTETFQPVAQVAGPSKQQLPSANDFVEVDPYTGQQTVNLEKFTTAVDSFNKASQEITQRASRAEQTIQNYIQTNEQREIEKQNKEAFAVHPELDPKGQVFDQQLSDFTRAVIYDSLINEQRYGGKPLSFKEAGDLVKSRMGVKVAPVVPVAVAEDAVAKAAQEAKDQGSLAAANVPQNNAVDIAQTQELEALRQVTRAGGQNAREAIARRLQQIEHIRKDVEETS